MGGIEGLNPSDPGIALLVEAVRGVPSRELLLVHCGDLPGVAPGATRLILDVRERAGAIATVVDDRLGALSIDAELRHAVLWPRAHLGKDFTRRCLARAADNLGRDGIVWCAVRKAKGADSVADAMRELVGPMDVVGRDKGYRLFRAHCHANTAAARVAVLAQRYRIEDPRLPGVALHSAPGVFSRRALDEGTAALMDYAAQTVSATEDAPRRVVDLCCGIGPLAIFAARRWPECNVVAVDSNVLAIALADENIVHNGVADRVALLAADGLPASVRAIDLALVNPPTHADVATLRTLVAGLLPGLAPGGLAMFVVSRAGRISQVLQDLGLRPHAEICRGYTIVGARLGEG